MISTHYLGTSAIPVMPTISRLPMPTVSQLPMPATNVNPKFESIKEKRKRLWSSKKEVQSYN